MFNLVTKLRGLALALVLAVSCAAPLAHADTLGTSGYANGSLTFDLSMGGSPAAGGFSGTWNSGAIVFWCIELTQFFGFGNNYNDYTASIPSGSVFTMLGQLFTEAYAAATSSATNSAAFQLAIWEIVYDDDLDLHSGGFQVLGGNSAAIAQAQYWLDHLSDYTNSYNLVLLTSASHQDFITFGTPFADLRVPEPASLALFGLALVAMFGVTRVRRRTV